MWTSEQKRKASSEYSKCNFIKQDHESRALRTHMEAAVLAILPVRGRGVKHSVLIALPLKCLSRLHSQCEFWITNLSCHIFRVNTMSIQRTLLVCTLMCVLLVMADAWWPFSSSSSEETSTEQGRHLKDSPVPFEMTTAEEKFLAQARKYMGDLTPLDSCHQIVSTGVIHKTEFGDKQVSQRKR